MKQEQGPHTFVEAHSSGWYSNYPCVTGARKQSLSRPVVVVKVVTVG